MFDNSTVPDYILKNPNLTQSLVLEELENRFLQQGKDVFIGDPNNTVVFMLEAFSSMTSQSFNSMINYMSKIYAKRARTSEDLYHHTSDYDYVELTASPSSMLMRLYLDAAWLRENAVLFDDNYLQAIIPAESVLVMGNRNFGLYYPIVFKINRHNGLIRVSYDLSVTNPLKTFKTNMLVEDYTFTQNGVEYLTIVFDVFQFTQDEKIITPHTSTNTGFQQVFTYTDQFYAARVYSKSSTDDTYQELSYTLSPSVYDIDKPTALLTILENEASLKVQIPVIYYRNNLVGNMIKVVIYSTEGYINESVSSDDMRNISFKIDSTQKYSSIFNQPPVFAIYPYDKTQLTGGTNAVDFTSFRRAVIDGTLYNQTPITTLQVRDWVYKYGFKMRKYLDNITDRIFFAGAALVTDNNRIVPMVNSQVKLDGVSLHSNQNSILNVASNFYTILPKTIFKYNTTEDRSYPLSQNDEDAINLLPKSKLVDFLNSNIHTQQPYHIVLNTSGKYPEARTFDLNQPVQKSLLFVKENVECDAQLSVINTSISYIDYDHNDPDNTGGFRIDLYINHSSSLKDKDYSDFTVILGYDMQAGLVYNKATYIGSTSNLDTFRVFMKSNFYITFEGNIQFRFNKSEDVETYISVGLTDSFDIKLGIPKDYYPDVTNDASMIENTHNNSYFDKVLFVSQQSITITFGEDLSTQIYNNIDTTWNQESYQTYTSNIPYTYNSDVFQTDPVTNNPIASIDNDGNVTLVKLFSRRDPVLTKDVILLTVAENLFSDEQLNSNLNTIKLTSVNNIIQGLEVYGVGIPLGSVIESIDVVNSTIVISKNITESVRKNNVLTVANPYLTKQVFQDSFDNIIYIETESDGTINKLVNARLKVVGLDIPADTYITDLTDNVVIGTSTCKGIVLSNKVNVKTGTWVTIYFDDSPYEYQYKIGDTILNSDGQPIISTTKNNVYLVTIPQFDRRLYVSEAQVDIDYAKVIPNKFTEKAHVLDPVRDQLLERTDLYYRPFRTLGNADFLVGNTSTVSMDLSISLSIKIYVPTAIYSKTSIRSTMESTTLYIITNYLQSTDVISVTELAHLLTESFQDNAISVNISGFDNVCGQQTMKIDTHDVLPSVAYKLELQEDNRIVLIPDIKIEFDTISDVEYN